MAQQNNNSDSAFNNINTDQPQPRTTNDLDNLHLNKRSNDVQMEQKQKEAGLRVLIWLGKISIYAVWFSIGNLFEPGDALAMDNLPIENPLEGVQPEPRIVLERIVPEPGSVLPQALHEPATSASPLQYTPQQRLDLLDALEHKRRNAVLHVGLLSPAKLAEHVTILREVYIVDPLWSDTEIMIRTINDVATRQQYALLTGGVQEGNILNIRLP